MLEQYRLYRHIRKLVKNSWEISEITKGYNYSVYHGDDCCIRISMSLYGNYIGSSQEVKLLKHWQQNRLCKLARKRYNWLCKYRPKNDAKDALGKLKEDL